MNKLGSLAQIEEEKLEIGDIGLLDKRNKLNNLKDISDQLESPLASLKSISPVQSNRQLIKEP